eukprot:52587-Pelagomonas_calceolata.AAC.1
MERLTPRKDTTLFIQTYFPQSIKRSAMPSGPCQRFLYCRILLKGVSKTFLGMGLASMDIGSTDRLFLQNLQIPER